MPLSLLVPCPLRPAVHSNSFVITYPPQLLYSQQPIPKGQSTDMSSHLSPCDSQSPDSEEDPQYQNKMECPSSSPQNHKQPYVYVYPMCPSHAMVKLTAHTASSNSQRATT